MRNFRINRVIKMVLLVVVGFALFSLIVMWLWNRLVPPIFGWHTINFWQALGIFTLSKILFGGVRSWGPGMHGRRRMMERWERMTPEEREKFRKGMQGFCGRSRVQSESEAPHDGPAQA